MSAPSIVATKVDGNNVAPIPVGEGLVLHQLRKSFGGIHALVDGSIAARCGEVHGVLGENGAGKSTLIRVLSGVITRDGGDVSLGSRALNLGSPARALEAGIRTVFQESSLIPALTLAENAFFDRLPVSWHRRLNWRELLDRYKAAFDELGARWLDPKATVATLSVADRQLLEVVKALAAKPRVLILDEATSALSLADAQWVLRQARRVASEGGVVLFVSHRLQEVKSLVDRVTVLRSGSTVFHAPMHAGVTENNLIEAMLGRRLGRLYPKRDTPPRSDVVLAAEGMTVGHMLGPIDLSLRAGEILGVTALPGQGQREFMLSIAGDLKADGQLTLAGRPYAPRRPEEAQNLGVFMVPEDRQREALFLSHTVKFNVISSVVGMLSGKLGLLNVRNEHKAARSASERVGLDPARLPMQVSTLSGGNQQKAIFARALLGEPKVFLLFDSTRGVDVGTKADIYRLVAHLADDGTCVVLYSTDFTETLHVCDRIIVLYDGKIAAAAPADLWDEETLLRAASGQTVTLGARREARDEATAP